MDEAYSRSLMQRYANPRDYVKHSTTPAPPEPNMLEKFFQFVSGHGGERPQPFKMRNGETVYVRPAEASDAGVIHQNPRDFVIDVATKRMINRHTGMEHHSEDEIQQGLQRLWRYVSGGK